MREHATESWSDTPCPPWCRREHERGDHPDDRRHQGRGHLLALMLSDRMPPSTPQSRAEVVIHADHGIDEQETWIRIESLESPAVRLALTTESAQELVDAISEVLRELSPFRNV